LAELLEPDMARWEQEVLERGRANLEAIAAEKHH
jgi:hypothetical protein